VAFSFFVGKNYGNKGYPQRNDAHMGSIWICGYPLLPYFLPTKIYNATLFYRGTYIQERRHLVTAALFYSHAHTDRCASQ
jgi:hypothetical protein